MESTALITFPKPLYTGTKQLDNLDLTGNTFQCFPLILISRPLHNA